MSPSVSKTASFVAVFLFALQAFAQSGGEALFNANCAKCHGRDGAGKTAIAAKLHIPDLGSRVVQSLTDTEIYDSIARGTRHKQYPHAYEFRGMSQADINSLVGYIRGLAKK
jgi:mono/diheme cytochrome c family protein